MKAIFKIDWSLIPTFLGLAITGIGLHISAERCTHEVWHNWSMAHVIFSLAFLICVICHIKMHWSWYRGWFKNGLGKKNRVTALLSVVFAFEVITGIVMLSVVDGAGSGIGKWHWGAGIALAVIGIGHLLKRLPTLKKGSRPLKK